MIMTSAISSENFFLNAYEKITLSDERTNLLLKISEGIIEEYKKEGVVNLNFIDKYDKTGYIYLKSGVKVPVASRRKEEFVSKLLGE